MRRLSAPGSYPVFLPGDFVQFLVTGGPVRARVVEVDVQARKDLPLGTPYRLCVIAAPPPSGYAAGTACTIRAACLERDPTVPRHAESLAAESLAAESLAAESLAAESLAAASDVTVAPVAPELHPAIKTFLVAFMREGGNFPLQGALIVQGDSLQAASEAAMRSLTSELEADVRERGELPEAMVMLLNAAEVPSAAAGVAVVASVAW